MASDIYQEAYQREKLLRKAAEQLLEDKSRELYASFEALQLAHQNLKENQKLVVQSEKMASLGVLSAGVAHEINNPIGFIYSNFCSMSEGLNDIHKFICAMGAVISEENDVAKIRAEWSNHFQQYDIEYLMEDFPSLSRETINGLERVKQIVADLKSFSREDSGAMDLVDINECLRSAVNILSNQTKYHATVDVEYGDVPKISGYFGKLNQVFTNLIANASQAVSENGLILLTTRCADGWIEVSVKDNGHGIAEEYLEQLFTPFFTTKPVGEGTGLGLSISHGFVQEHDGEILVESTVGQGTTFTVRLPVKKTV